MAIFAVCYAHICGGDFSVTLIDYFSLGVFFIVAGMTLVPERYENFGQFLWRKVKSYVIPILCMDVITIIINVSFLLVKGQMDQITLTYFFDESVPLFRTLGCHINLLLCHLHLSSCQTFSQEVVLRSSTLSLDSLNHLAIQPLLQESPLLEL